MKSRRSPIGFLGMCGVLICCLVLSPGRAVFAEEGETTIVLSNRVGEVIDREERDFFRMFKAYQGFKSAVFLQLADGSYAVDIVYQEDGEEVKIRSPQSAESIKSLRDYIDNFEELAPGIFDEAPPPSGKLPEGLVVPDSNQVQILTTIDGSTLIGRVVEISNGEVEFETKLGVLTIAITEIKEIKLVGASAMKEGTYWFANPNATRLFFAATGRSLKKGEGYFADYYLFFPMLAYGITNNITVAGGMSLLPTNDIGYQLFYFLPKVGIIQNERGAVSAGIMMLKFPDWGSDEGPLVGIAYGVGTLGSTSSSLTAGLGYGYVDWDFADKPMVMVGGEMRVSQRVSLVTENWLVPGLDKPFVSGGVRFFGEKLAVDLALISTLESLIFPGIPYIDFVVQF